MHNSSGRLVCDGYVCGFAEEVREQTAVINAAIGNIRDRMNSFEGYLDRISSMVHNTHRDTMDIRRTLRVLHGECNYMDSDPEEPYFKKEETDRWLTRQPYGWRTNGE